jgi:phosphoesterase RecJ-like protein
MAGAEEQSFLDLLGPGRRFVLTTHVHPDGDGIASEHALARLIESRGGEVRIVNVDPAPPSLDFLDAAGEIEIYDPARHDAPIAGADVVVMLDNSDPSRLGPMAGAFEKTGARRVSIDHHPDPEGFWDLFVIRQGASSTAEIVFDLYHRAGEPLTPRVAAALYAGLVCDTGRFRFASTSPSALRMAADLVAAGASPAAIHAELEERLSSAFLRLQGRILGAAEVRCEGRLVLLRVPLALLRELAAEREDLSDVINETLRLDGSRVAALFRELPDGRTKISLRSKGPLDVNRLARGHGGGGHRNASGAVVEIGLDATIARLLPELESLAAQG